MRRLRHIIFSTFYLCIISFKVICQIDSVKIYVIDPHNTRNIYTAEEEFREQFTASKIASFQKSRFSPLSPFVKVLYGNSKTSKSIMKEIKKLQKMKDIDNVMPDFTYRILIDVFNHVGINETVSFSDMDMQYIQYRFHGYDRRPKFYKMILGLLPPEYSKDIKVKNPE